MTKSRLKGGFCAGKEYLTNKVYHAILLFKQYKYNRKERHVMRMFSFPIAWGLWAVDMPVLVAMLIGFVVFGAAHLWKKGTRQAVEFRAQEMRYDP